MAEDLSAIKYFSTFLIVTVSFQISIYLMTVICPKCLLFPSTSTDAYAAIFVIMGSQRSMQT